MHIVVLGGAGDMGSHAVRDLLTHTEAQVTVADYRLEAAQALVAELGAGDRVQARFVDANDPASLSEVLSGADAAIGCIGPFYAYATKVARGALAAGVPYVDICDDYGPIEELFALDEEAKAKGITLITGLGWTPGITNLLARKGASQFDTVEQIHIAWAGGAEDSQGLAVVMHVLYAVTGDVPSYRKGEWVQVPASSGKEKVVFPQPLGKIEVFHCGHPEPLTIPRYIPVQTVTLKGGLTPAWNNTLADVLVRLGVSKTPKRIERTARLIHKLEGLLGAGGVPFSGARVEVIGFREGARETVSYAVVDKMGRLTGIPAAVGAVMLAEKKLPPGVYAPEGCLDPDAFLAELARRDILVHSGEPDS